MSEATHTVCDITFVAGTFPSSAITCDLWITQINSAPDQNKRDCIYYHTDTSLENQYRYKN
jgi:hypothetical protein